MIPKNIQVLFIVGSIVWVAEWGFLMFRYPKFFAEMNARFGLRILASPKFVKLTRWMGIVCMTLAGISVLSELVMLSLT